MQRNRFLSNFKNNPYSYRMIKFVLFCLVIFIFTQGFLFAERRMRPAILSIAELKVSQIATKAVNDAILDNVARGVSYQDLINVKFSEEERIVVARVNTMEINRLVAKTTVATQDALEEIQRMVHIGNDTDLMPRVLDLANDSHHGSDRLDDIVF